MNNQAEYLIRWHKTIEDLRSFDWSCCTVPEFRRGNPLMNCEVVGSESYADGTLRSLRPLNQLCKSCRMCELGRRDAERNGVCRDPHVFSNMNPSKFVVVGQNPGWDELCDGVPFVGAAGRRFDQELENNGITRDKLYITNTLKCYTLNNVKPNYRQIQRCSPLLQLELAILRPKLIIALGAVAFSRLIPDGNFSNSLRTIKSVEIGCDTYKVFPVYHPSPLNLSDTNRMSDFKRQMKILCKLIKSLAD
jgi:uracil-DNA glycosylase